MVARVAIVGAGIAGASCAERLRAAGIEVTVYERARTAGGRLAAPRLDGRRVDIGAAYFTVSDPEFAGQAQTWLDTGLARHWTDTFDVIGAHGRSTTTGPMRWAGTDGLRALVRAMAPDERVTSEITDLDALDDDAVVLAMPDPQAARVARGVFEQVAYEPVIAVAASWDERCWDLETAAFVNDDLDLALIADDGSRRGDHAAVLVAHTSADLARRHLSDPQSALDPVLHALRRTLGIDRQPVSTYVHRWTFAKPADTHGGEPFGLSTHRGRPLGLCGDSWCPSGSPRVEAAWLSGRRLGQALAERLG